MLKNVFHPEEMKENEKYFCNKCNNYTPLAIKQAFLHSMPNHLILTLNRFWYDFKEQKKKKIMKQIEIPLILDLQSYSKKPDPNNIYEIYAILIHKVQQI